MRVRTSSGSSGAARSRVRTRRMTREDLDAVGEVERGAYSNPWSRQTFEELLERTPWELWVLLVDDEVVGHGVCTVVADEGEIANLAIRADRRERGFGARLLRLLEERAIARGVERLFLEVRRSNAPAIALYRRHGYEEIGVRRGYYENPDEDARVFRKRFGSISEEDA